MFAFCSFVYSRTASTTRARSPSSDDAMVPVVDEMTMVSDATTVVGVVVVGTVVVGAAVVGAAVVGAVVGTVVVGAAIVGAVVVGATDVGATVVGGIVVGLLTIHYFHPSFSLLSLTTSSSTGASTNHSLFPFLLDITITTVNENEDSPSLIPSFVIFGISIHYPITKYRLVIVTEPK